MQRYSEYKDSGVQWLGEIPSHWEVKPLKHVVTYNDEVLLETEKKDRQIKYIEIGDVDNVSGVKKYTEYEFKDAPSRARRITHKGDVIVSTVRTYLKAITSIEDDGFIVSTGFTVLRANKVKKIFLKYYLLSDSFINEVISLSVGTSYPAINSGELVAIKMPVPSACEQENISVYLDEVTSKIDKAIAQQQKMIDLLNERKQIIINNAVTKGLNPNVKMKDSGVEWIGEIPEHWEVIRIKHLLRESKIRSMRGKEEPLSMSQSYGLIPTKNMETIPNMASSYAGAKIVKKGNLVFNKLKAHLGVFNVSKYDGLVSPDYAVYSSLGKVNLRFLEYLFKTPKCIYEFVKLITGVGAGLSRLYTSDLFSIYCAIPSLEEQNSICSYIQNRTLKIDESIMLYRKQISLLQERKQIIINDVVTGKVKVV